ncbi:MAG: flagellar hook-basal body complex protein FliE [Desulfatirhabdiaceae bacterium]
MNPISIYSNPNALTYSPPGKPESVKPESVSFGDMLKTTIQQVNHLQIDSNTAIENMVTGKEKDIHNTMIAMEKASVSLQMMMQTRNKMIEAYQEVMRMSV